MKHAAALLIAGFALCLNACDFVQFDWGGSGMPIMSKCDALQGVARFGLVKLDNSGKLQWKKSFDAPATFTSAPILAHETTDGYVATFTNQNIETSIVFFDKEGGIKSQKIIAQRTAATYPQSLAPTADGGHVIAGSKNSQVSADLWVLKLDKSGNTEWEKTFGGSSDESAYAIRQTADMGYIVAGTGLPIDGNGNPVSGATDYWIVKLTPAGSVEWQKTFGGCSGDRANSVRQTGDGGYIVAGMVYTEACNILPARGYEYGVVKLDKSGNTQWYKYLGGSQSDWATSVGQSSDGGYYVAGVTQSSDGDVRGLHGMSDYWIVKLDPQGAIKWQKTLGGSGIEEIYSMSETVDGGYITCGLATSNDGDVTQLDAGDGNFWIVKLTDQGSIQWQSSVGGPCYDTATSIQPTSDGGYIVAGTVVE